MSGFAVRGLFVVALLSSLAHAQATGGRLSGTVNDPQGAKLPGVDVTVVNPVTGQKFETRASERGDWVIPAIPPAHSQGVQPVVLGAFAGAGESVLFTNAL